LLSIDEVPTKHHVLYDNQYDFRPNLSTTYAMLDIVSRIKNNINNKVITGLVLIDLKKLSTQSHMIYC